jgi:hypothetical protein
VFLTLHDGWDNFWGEGGLLSTAEHAADWVRDSLPAPQLALRNGGPVLLKRNCAAPSAWFDLSARKPDGELEVVAYDGMIEPERHSSFIEFIEAYLAMLERAIDVERKGIS